MKNKPAPDVSVVIPTHNRKVWIEKAINSVREQTYLGILEIIVVDDASTDGTADFIKSKFPDVLVLVNEHNEGACFSRNKGVESAQGDYLSLIHI